MLQNFKAILSPSSFIDSSCYSAEGFCEPPPRQLWIPSIFDSDEPNYVHICRERSTMSQSSSSELTPIESSSDEAEQETLVTPSEPSKPPRPALPRPLNITAYTKPNNYNAYINSTLVPATLNVAHSSLTTIIDQRALYHLRHEDGHKFVQHIDKEMRDRRKNGSLMWIRNVLFSDAAVPHDFKQKFQDSNLWDDDEETWVNPPKRLDEEEMGRWLNCNIRKFGLMFNKYNNKGHAYDIDCDRSWDDRTSTSPPTGGTQQRKPDLSLLSREVRSYLNANARPGWPNILSFAEVTKSKKTFDKVVRNIIEKAYLVFEGQPFRRYVVALGFFGPEKSPKWALVLVDRAGVVTSCQFKFSGSEGIILAHVIYALGFAKPFYIGIDDTMTIDPLKGIVTHITVTGEIPSSEKADNKRTFEVVRLLHATSQVSGRATRVWLVRRNGRFYILKDSWPRNLKNISEIAHLLKINKTIREDEEASRSLKHIYPVLVIGQELQDSTLLRRSEIPKKPMERVHRRIVTKPIGDPLTSFRSKYELCSVLCDVVTFLKYASEKCKVCHGDISLNNIVIHRIWDDDDDDDIDNCIDNDIDDIDDIVRTNDSSDCNNSELIFEPSSTSMMTTNQPSTSTSSSSTIKAYGLVIDYDNAFSLENVSDFKINSGTAPFMALDSLKWTESSEFTHQPKHDLESLFYVILTLCTYTTGPGCLSPHVPKDGEISVCLNEWWVIHDRHQLARNKGGLLSSLDEFIISRLSSYWVDFHPVLKELHKVIWPAECAIMNQPNMATHDAFLKVLKEARERYSQAEETAHPLAFAPIAAEHKSERSTHLRGTGKDVAKGTTIKAASQKRKGTDTTEDVDDGATRGKKAPRADGNNRVAFILPHNVSEQSFPSYVDSGVPLITE